MDYKEWLEKERQEQRWLTRFYMTQAAWFIGGCIFTCLMFAAFDWLVYVVGVRI